MGRFGGIGIAWLVATVVAVTIAAAAVGSVRSEVTGVPTALGVSASPPPLVDDPDQLSDLSNQVFDEETGTTTTLVVIVETVPAESPIVEITTSSTTTTTEPAVTQLVILAEGQARHEEPTKTLPQAGAAATTSPTSPAQPNATVTTTTTKPATITTATTTTIAPTAPTVTSTTTSTTTTIPAPKPYTRAIDTEGGSLSVRVNGDAVTFRRAFPHSGWRFDLANGGPDEVEARFTNTDNRSTRIRVLVRVVNGTLDISISPPN